MRSSPLAVLFERWILPVVISVLVLADGIIHLRLDYLLFHGTLWGTPSFGGGGHPAGPPPGGAGAAGGGPPPGGHGGGPGGPFPFEKFQLNELFLLNFLAAAGLVIAFWLAYELFGRWAWVRAWRWLVDVAILGFAAYSIWAWWHVGKPNPQNLGHLSKGIEVALIVIVLTHLVLVVRRLGLPGRASGMVGQQSPAR